MSASLGPEALRERIRIESPTLISDNAGGHTRSWQLVKEVFAEIKPLQRSILRAEARQILTNAAYRIRVRAPLTVDETMRVLWRDKQLMIDYIQPSSEWLLLTCSEEA